MQNSGPLARGPERLDFGVPGGPAELRLVVQSLWMAEWVRVHRALAKSWWLERDEPEPKGLEMGSGEPGFWARVDG